MTKRRTLSPEMLENVRKEYRAKATLEDAKLSKDITFDEAVEAFIVDRKRKGCSQGTIDYYEQHLSTYKKRYIQMYDEHPPRRILRRHIDDFIHFGTKVLGNKKSSIHTSLRAVKAYCTFLVKSDIEDVNPFDKIPIPKDRHKEIETFSDKQLATLLRMPNLETFVGFRDFVMIQTFLDTGIRLTELLALELDDIYFSDKYLAIRGKNGRVRHVPFSEELQPLIRKWLRIRGDVETEVVFITEFNKPLKKRSVQNRFEKYGKMAGITNVRVSPHTCRHTFAKMYVKSGGNIFALQDILGHQTLDMVRVYVNLFSGELYNDHRKRNPLKQLRDIY
ncbi:tyrosine-type recombinase/integrase [Abyssicoccus albus]|uniref:Integrase/recombinase XerD n=1 Tax=Abyssicoccus albus TaxID=1817405 RepID=A0A3N5C8K1_9BACL|nr:tyrosine-type recombinase/integrase [Abyssicoccus albus]RPF54795.1 integrase/recombinase XerD [Abyssicoccus albus]